MKTLQAKTYRRSPIQPEEIKWKLMIFLSESEVGIIEYYNLIMAFSKCTTVLENGKYNIEAEPRGDVNSENCDLIGEKTFEELLEDISDYITAESKLEPEMHRLAYYYNEILAWDNYEFVVAYYDLKGNVKMELFE